MKKIIFLFTLTFLISSAKQNSQSEEIRSDILVSVINLDEGIELRCKTEQSFSCSNYSIDFDVKTQNNEIFIQFNKLNIPDMGTTSFGPAKCTIGIGKLANGEYPVTFVLNKKKTKGKLVVGTSATLTIDAVSNVKLN